jgi:hypothetical protein
MGSTGLFNFGEASTKVSNPPSTKKKGGKFSALLLEISYA